MSRNVVVIEGKTKIVKTNPNDPATVFLYFKDDITAGDGAKHDVLEGKAVLTGRSVETVLSYSRDVD